MVCSTFELFKIGVGPSSSHTMGPWIAARYFSETINLTEVESVRVKLFGSLAKTGRGHGTDIAVMLRSGSHQPTTIEVEKLDSYIEDIYQKNELLLKGKQLIPFFPLKNIEFIFQKLPFHPNGLTFIATYKNGGEHEKTYYSIGGGFVI